ncbi:MAG: M56 family metallopeptidase [Pirellulaceae bacterium]|nr:M48 family metalloprotease [Planctomycetales bacterium]
MTITETPTVVPRELWELALHPWSQLWAISLLHATWQVFVVGCMYSIGRLCIEREHAERRYAWGMSCLLLAAGLPLINAFGIGLLGDNREIGKNDSDITISDSFVRTASDTISHGDDNATRAASLVRLDDSDALPTPIAVDSRQRATTTADRTAADRTAGGGIDAGGTRARDVAERRLSFDNPPETAEVPRFVLVHWLPSPRPWVFLGWCAGLVASWLRYAAGHAYLHWLRQHRVALSPEMEARATQLCGAMKLRAQVLVAASSQAGCAIASGLLRPMVLLPTSWLSDLTPEMLEAVIAHELAHIRRHDLWANLCQNVAQSLLFFHPVVWWIAADVRHEREKCCDRLAANAINNTHIYACTLHYLAGEQRAPWRDSATAVAMGGNSMKLLDRVQYVLGIEAARSDWAWWPWGGLLVIALAWNYLAAPAARVVADDGGHEQIERIAEEAIIAEAIAAEAAIEEAITDELDAIAQSADDDDSLDLTFQAILAQREGDRERDGDRARDRDRPRDGDFERDRPRDADMFARLMERLERIEMQLDRQARRMDNLERKLAGPRVEPLEKNRVATSEPTPENVIIRFQGNERMEKVKADAERAQNAAKKSLQESLTQRKTEFKHRKEQLAEEMKMLEITAEQQRSRAEVELQLAELQLQKADLQVKNEQAQLSESGKQLAAKLQRMTELHKQGNISIEELEAMQAAVAANELAQATVAAEREIAHKERELQLKARHMEVRQVEMELQHRRQELERQITEMDRDFERQMQEMKVQFELRLEPTLKK